MKTPLRFQSICGKNATRELEDLKTIEMGNLIMENENELIKLTITSEGFFPSIPHWVIMSAMEVFTVLTPTYSEKN
jgi:hypothetical protein